MEQVTSLTFSAILMVVILIAWWEVSKIAFRKMKNDWKLYKINRAKIKEYKAKQKNMEEMKTKGELHDWITMPIEGIGEDVTVCKKTGWVPSKQGFLPLQYIRRFEEQKRVDQKIEEEYTVFKQSRMEDISVEYGIPMEDMENLMDQIYRIRKDFHVQKMEQSIEEFQKVIEGLHHEGSK